MERLLVVDDSIPFLKDIKLLLSKKYDVETVINARLAIELIKKDEFTAILLDIKMPDMSGLEVMQKLKEDMITVPPIIIISDFGEIGLVVDAIKLGASDYIQKDFNLEVLTQKINNAVQKNKLQRKVEYLKQAVLEEKTKFIYKSMVMQNVNKKISSYAKLSCNILLKGETGVGKDLIAEEIFTRSEKYNDLFVSIPISSLSENLIESELFGYEKGAFTGAENAKKGKLETANDGTIYLPEISSISENIQLKLLQFMQYNTISRIGQNDQKPRKINTRIIMATNDNLEDKVKAGKMRSDFFYRIDSVSIEIPPLRERQEDIQPLAEYFTQKHSMKILGREISIDKGCISELEKYSWPGNVRQLNNAILKAIVNMESDEDLLACNHLPYEIVSKSEKELSQNISNRDYENAKRKFKKEYFTNLLEQTNNNYTKTAELAGISRTGLDKALKELGIK